MPYCTCSICKKPAVVEVKVNDGEEVLSGWLCESCIHAAAKLAKVTVTASIHPLYPVGYTIGEIPESNETEPDEPDEMSIYAPPVEPERKESPALRFAKKNRSDLIVAGVIIGLTLILAALCATALNISKSASKSSSSYTSTYGTSIISDSTKKPDKSSYISAPSSSSRSSSSSSSDVYIPSTLSDALMSKMWDAAKEEVKRNLKSPSTAKFEKYYSNDVKFVKGKADDVKNGGFNVTIFAYVDSQNGFGAEIRTTFAIFFMVDKTDSFKIVDSYYR